MHDVTRLFRDGIRNQTAYPVEAGSYDVKLDANENPYGFPESLKEELGRCLTSVPLNRYPEAGSGTLKRLFAADFGVTEDRILIGNGSDELIFILLAAVDQTLSGGVLIPSPTFAMYRIGALNTGHRLIDVPLDHAFKLDGERLLETVRREKPGIVFFSYPNNPTGNCFDEDIIRAVIKESDGIVVVDEAYGVFSGRTFLTEAEEYENLVILRTLSKIGFAALRVGFLVGHPAVVHELNKVRLPYNLNALSQAAAVFYVTHKETFDRQIETIIRDREWLARELSSISALSVYPTDANFVLFGCDKKENDVYNHLLTCGVLVKQFSAPAPLAGKIRVTVGTREENSRFLQALREALLQ